MNNKSVSYINTAVVGSYSRSKATGQGGIGPLPGTPEYRMELAFVAFNIEAAIAVTEFTEIVKTTLDPETELFVNKPAIPLRSRVARGTSRLLGQYRAVPTKPNANGGYN